jgi:hypothetical protein
MVKKLSKASKALLDKGLEDARAGRIVPHYVQMDFFNDTGKNILIRTTPFTHAKNPEMIRPRTMEKIYVVQGFLKLWDQGGYFQLMVE